MLSPVKLYKSDMKTQHVARTWGPKGKPYSKAFHKTHPQASCSGSMCYRHKNVDWTVHRLAPAISSRAKPGGVVRRAIGHRANMAGGGYTVENNAKAFLQRTSPRWGNGRVPSRMEGRKVVPLPKRSSVEVSKGTKIAAAGVAVAGASYLGYKAYQHHEANKVAAPRTKARVGTKPHPPRLQGMGKR